MFATPVETLTVTVLPLATLLPLSGFVLITRPDCTAWLASLCSTGTRPAALIADCRLRLGLAVHQRDERGAAAAAVAAG